MACFFPSINSFFKEKIHTFEYRFRTLYSESYGVLNNEIKYLNRCCYANFIGIFSINEFCKNSFKITDVRLKTKECFEFMLILSNCAAAEITLVVRRKRNASIWFMQCSTLDLNLFQWIFYELRLFVLWRLKRFLGKKNICSPEEQSLILN